MAGFTRMFAYSPEAVGIVKVAYLLEININWVKYFADVARAGSGRYRYATRVLQG